VALSGDGGDELFGGYAKYRLQERLSRWPLRRAAAAVLAGVPWRAVAAVEHRLRAGRASLTPQRAGTLTTLLRAPDDLALAERLSLLNRDAASLLRAPESTFVRPMPADLPTCLGPLRTPMLLDQLAYLPDDVLTKVDRATMSASLESRAPLLDHRVAEFAATLPVSYLSQGGVGKCVLRALLERHVPKALFDRPKQGFSVPMARWLRHELKDWAHDVLAPSASRASPLDLHACTALLESHRRGERDASAALWPALVLQTWLDHTGTTA
jgi:asparagine synthase (glutamine-hydrolysing)